MVEKRTTQRMPSLIRPKETSGAGSGPAHDGKDKPTRKESAAGDGDGNGDHEQTEETNHLPSHTGITKPGPAAVEETSPSVSMGTHTYNPITHAPSMYEVTRMIGLGPTLHIGGHLKQHTCTCVFYTHMSSAHLALLMSHALS